MKLNKESNIITASSPKAIICSKINKVMFAEKYVLLSILIFKKHANNCISEPNLFLLQSQFYLKKKYLNQTHTHPEIFIDEIQ